MFLFDVFVLCFCVRRSVMFRKLLLVGLVLAMVASVASANLVARYEFQGNYIDSTGDVDGSYQNGTPVGNASIAFTGDPTNGYLVLDNKVTPASYVDIGSFNILNPANNAFTLSAWVLPDTAWATTKDMPIAQKGDEFGIKFKANDTLECYFQSAGTGNYWYWANVPKTRIAEIWADGLFHLVTGTYDPAVAEIKLYVDGVLEATNTGYTGSTGWVVGDTIKQTTDKWYIGSDSKSGHSTRLYTGLIDDVRIYDEALSAARVAALVPEPATIALLGLGGLSLLRIRRKR
jgi:hypothetical protein